MPPLGLSSVLVSTKWGSGQCGIGKNGSVCGILKECVLK